MSGLELRQLLDHVPPESVDVCGVVREELSRQARISGILGTLSRLDNRKKGSLIVLNIFVIPKILSDFAKLHLLSSNN